MVNSKRITPIACCPFRLNPYIIIRLLNNSPMVIPKSFIGDFGTMLIAEPPSTRIQLTIWPQIFPATNNGRLCGLEPNNKSSLMNITTLLQVAHWAGLRTSGVSFSLSIYSFAWQMATTICSRIASSRYRICCQPMCNSKAFKTIRTLSSLLRGALNFSFVSSSSDLEHEVVLVTTLSKKLFRKNSPKASSA